jgi:hypothetical protein
MILLVCVDGVDNIGGKNGADVGGGDFIDGAGIGSGDGGYDGNVGNGVFNIRDSVVGNDGFSG